ncbi:alpha/beta fold hydrolase [Kitasatospora sp. NPDC001664]
MTLPAHGTHGVGTPLVLLHAFPLSARMWQAQLAPLADVATLITPDQRGFGATPVGDAPPSLDTVADDLVELLDELGLEQAVFGGLSMGGYVAMALARRHPERIAGLLLADTKATVDTPAAKANRERIAGAVLARDSVALLAEEKIEDGLLGPGADPELTSHVREMIAAASPAGVAWAQRAMAARPESLAALRALDVPAVVVVGEHDALTPLAEARLIAEALPGAELTVIPGVGHLSSLEAPESFNAAARALLRRC